VLRSPAEGRKKNGDNVIKLGGFLGDGGELNWLKLRRVEVRRSRPGGQVFAVCAVLIFS
jgi:hypothetical protein